MNTSSKLLPLLTLGASLAALLPLAACGDDDDNAGAGPAGSAGQAGSAGSASGGQAGAAQAPDLAGRWKSACLASPQSDGTTQHTDLDFTIDASSWAVDYTVHGNETCTAPFVRVHIAGPYTLVAPSSQVPGAWDAVFSFTTKTATPEMDAAVGFLSGLANCGDGSFTLGTADDVYTAGCPGLGQYPQSSCSADHDLVKRDGDTLRFGSRPADNNLCTDDRRPTALSAAVLTRQP